MSIIEAETLAEAIVMLRAKKKITQKELADFVGCSPGHISRIEAGETEPSLGILKKIAAGLNANITLAERKNGNEN
jgi:transcriptional regulator with XRE-family HTH domain